MIYKQGKISYTILNDLTAWAAWPEQMRLRYDMKGRIIPFLLTFCLLAGCGQSAPTVSDQTEEGELAILTTTYPLYLFASAVTQGVEGVTVDRLDTGNISCLHDYTLSVSDMKKIEGADVIVLNGAGLEDFMDDALAASSAAVIDCSQGEELLFTLEHSQEHEEEHDHDHDHGDYDAHIWMSPMRADHMAGRIRESLEELDPDHAQQYQENAEEVSSRLGALDVEISALFDELEQSGRRVSGLITFHEGFQYFAQDYGLPLLAAIEEEAGSEASAKEILEITQLIQEYDLPVIFTEVNGSDATANAIARETGCQVAQLTMVMDGPDDSLDNYIDGLLGNAKTIVNAFAGQEVVS